MLFLERVIFNCEFSTKVTCAGKPIWIVKIEHSPSNEWNLWLKDGGRLFELSLVLICDAEARNKLT